MNAMREASRYGRVEVTVTNDVDGSYEVWCVIDPQASAGVILGNEYALAAGMSECVCDPYDYERAVGSGATIARAATNAVYEAQRLSFERGPVPVPAPLSGHELPGGAP